MNNPFLEAMQHMFDDNGYAPGAGRNVYRANPKKICDYPKFDPGSILECKVFAYCNRECPFCRSDISVHRESVCGGHGIYYNPLYIYCDCGLKFLIRDDKSIDLWNNCDRKGEC